MCESKILTLLRNELAQTRVQCIDDWKLFIINTRPNFEIFAVLEFSWATRDRVSISSQKFNKIRSPDARRSLAWRGRVGCATVSFRRLVAYTSPASLFRYTLGDNLPLFASRVGWIIRRAENRLSKSVKDCFQKRTTLYFDVVCVCVCVCAFRRTWEHVKQFRIIFLERCARILPLWLTLLRFRFYNLPSLIEIAHDFLERWHFLWDIWG